MAKCLKQRLFITGEINAESYAKFTTELAEFEDECFSKHSPGEVTLEICSEGGEAVVALAFHDRIQESPIVIKGHALGLVASAATLVWIACNERTMGESAWIMVHEDSFTELDGKITELEKTIRHARMLEDQWVLLFSRCAPSVKYGDWLTMHKDETYLGYYECRAFGLLTGEKI